MDTKTINKIIEINREFYQTFAQPFAATRMRLQPGVKRILQMVQSDQTILDLGCGNGELARVLFTQGFEGKYLGADFSEDLLKVASHAYSYQNFAKSKQHAEILLEGNQNQGIFIQADLTGEDWNTIIPTLPFDLVFCFAVLHHIPGDSLRLDILKRVHQYLKPGGFFWHSEWQFMNSPRLRARIQPWAQIDLDEAQVEPGDYLLDWRHGGTGYRYVHLFDPSELNRLADLSGFSIVESFFSDGEGGRLALYQKWQAVTP